MIVAMPETSLALNLQGKSREELLRTKQLLETEITSIRTQLARARADSRERGRFANVLWWCKIHQALRIKGRQCQQIQLELGRMRAAHQHSVERHFLDIARERMDPLNFKVFLETAKQRALNASREE